MRPRRSRPQSLLTVIALGAGALFGVVVSAGAPASATNTGTITVNSTSAVGTPWLGYGLNYYPVHEKTPGPYTAAEQSLDQSRLDVLHPQIVRVTWNTTYFDPTSTVGSYDWTTTAAQGEFAALDYLKARNIPVMTGWWSTPWSSTSSSYSTAVADFVQYLVQTRGYTNIKYFDGINEPNHRDPATYANFKVQATNTQNALTGRGLSVRVIGPGTQDTAADNWITSSATDLSGVMAGYDKHLYPTGASDISSGSQETYLRNLEQTLRTNDPSNKPFFIEEMGNKYGYTSATDSQPAVTTFGYGLDMADLAVQAARAGTAAPMAWWLDDLNNKEWGMFDADASDTSLRPWSYPWDLLENFIPAGSTIYAPSSPTGVRVLAARSGSASAAHWTVALVNRTSATVQPDVVIPGYGAATLSKYAYHDGSRAAGADGFPVATGTVSATLNSGFTVNVPANSMMLLTTIGNATVTTSTASAAGQTDVDYLNDWSNTSSHTSGWTLDSTNSSAYFTGDTSRATRTANTTESVVYRADGLSTFDAHIYYLFSASGRVSVDAASSATGPWTTVPVNASAGSPTGGNWFVSDYTPAGALPSGTNYLRITFTNDARGYTPQLGQLSTTHGAS